MSRETISLADISSDVSYGYTESASQSVVGPKFLRITDIQDGVVDWDTVPYCPISEKDFKKYQLSYGDIVVARTGNSTGENYIFTSNVEAVFASYLIKFAIDSSIADPMYVWYTMRTANWWNYVNGSKTGSAQAGANARVLGRYSFELPKISEQKAIAHILGTLDDKIELNRQTNKTLEDIAKAIFKSWFIDFDPVHYKRDGRVPNASADTPYSLSSEIIDLFPDSFQDSELGEIPAGWEVKSLEECIDLLYGKALKKDDRETGPYQVFGSNGPIGEHSEKLVDGPGIVVGRKGNPGIVKWAQNDFYPIDTTFYVKTKYISSHHYLFYALQYLELASLSSDSAVPGLNRQIAYLSNLIVPSSKSLEIFESHMDVIRKKQDLNNKESDALAAIRDSLIPKLISGELPIENAEKFLEQAGV